MRNEALENSVVTSGSAFGPRHRFLRHDSFEKLARRLGAQSILARRCEQV
jgi:hypothetical protein